MTNSQQTFSMVKMKAFPPKEEQDKVTTLATFIQRNFESPSHGRGKK